MRHGDVELRRMVSAYVMTVPAECRDAVREALGDFIVWARRRNFGLVGAMVWRRQCRFAPERMRIVNAFVEWVVKFVSTIRDLPTDDAALAALAGDLDAGDESDLLVGTDSPYWGRVFRLIAQEIPAPVIAEKLGIRGEVVRAFVNGNFPARMKASVAERSQRLFVILMARKMGIREDDIDHLVIDEKYEVQRIDQILTRSNYRYSSKSKP